MNWRKLQERWDKRGASTGPLDSGVSFTVEPWDIPGEQPLQVRVCKREGKPPATYAKLQETPKTSIVLHHTSGYGNLGTLMGDSPGHGAHFLVGRDGNVYSLVDTRFVAHHTKGWNQNSIGIEVDNIGRLKPGKDDVLYDEYGDPYCTKADDGIWVEKKWPRYGDYWATWTESQYAAVARLLKALCAKHDIPRRMLPGETKFSAFDLDRDRPRFRGICVHININPDNRDDLGPYVDWPKLVRYGGLTEGDCFTARATPEKTSAPAPAPKPLPAAAQVNAQTVRVPVGARPGRISLTVKKAGEPVKTAPRGEPPARTRQESKRDEFLAHALALRGTPWRSGSSDPAEGGLDGPGLISLCLKKVGIALDRDPDHPLSGPALAARYAPICAEAAHPPAEIRAGDIAWFGEGDHDHVPTQHPLIWLGDGKVMGSLPLTQHVHHDRVQVMKVADVGEPFAGFSHIDELGEEVQAGSYPLDEPDKGQAISAALLPGEPDALYDALQGIVKDAGGTWKSDAGKVNLVGVTNCERRCQISPKPAAWNDTLFAAWVDKDGHKHAIDARASLDPGHDEHRAGTWHLAEGSYAFKLSRGALVPAGSVRGWKDEAGSGALRPPEGPPQPVGGEVSTTPRLRGLAQYDARWSSPKTPVYGDRSWQGNACHPTSITMVLRWIAEDNPQTKGRFAFPHKDGSEIPEEQYPRRLMEAFWPDLGGQVKPDRGHIPHDDLRLHAETVLGMTKDSSKVALKGSLEKKLETLRGALGRGPLVIGIPGHFVVLQAVEGDHLLIVDPGDVIANHWQTEDGHEIERGAKCGMPPRSAWSGGFHDSECRAPMYVRVPIRKKVKRPAYKNHDAVGAGYMVDMLSPIESYWVQG